MHLVTGHNIHIPYHMYLTTYICMPVGIFEAIGLPVPVPKPLMEVAEPLKSVCHVLRLCLGNNLISGLYLLGECYTYV